MKACDHSTGGAIIGGALANAGYGGVFRYACAGRANVNITPAEIADLHAHGVAVAIVCEQAANFLLDGWRTGHDQAQGAQQICRACGLPDGVVYMAGDFDATGSSSVGPLNPNMLAILASLQGAIAAVGSGNVGFYGGYYAIDWLVQHGPAGLLFWQCESAYGAPGRLHPQAVAIQQLTGPISVGGVSIDADETLTAVFWGQRGHQSPTPAPTPPPPPSKGHLMLASAVNQDGRQEVFTVLASGQVKHIWQTSANGSWNGDPGVTAYSWEGLGNVGGTPIGITAGSNQNGHLEVQVKLDDGSVVHSWQTSPSGAWYGAAAGVTHATWQPLGNPGV